MTDSMVCRNVAVFEVAQAFKLSCLALCTMLAVVFELKPSCSVHNVQDGASIDAVVIYRQLQCPCNLHVAEQV